VLPQTWSAIVASYRQETKLLSFCDAVTVPRAAGLSKSKRQSMWDSNS
jgi:hypothetical protein